MGATEKIVLWKKGEKAKTQCEIYSKLIQGYTVVFYQEGNEGTDSFKIEMAIDAVSLKKYYDNYLEIREGILSNSKGRQICKFNL